MKIKLAVWCEGYLPDQFDDDSSDFDIFVASEVNKDKLLHSFEKDNPFNEMKIIEFEIPDDLDKQLIFDICSGKSHNLWYLHNIDFSEEYHASWVFIEKNNKLEILDIQVDLE
jgi:hypothetical protein